MYRFLSLADLLVIHNNELSITPHEPPGIHSMEALEAAIYAPINLWLYSPEAKISEIAARYAYHIALNHPFLAGNKRTAHAACIVFIQVNGYSFRPSGTEFAIMIERAIMNQADISDIVDFIDANISMQT